MRSSHSLQREEDKTRWSSLDFRWQSLWTALKWIVSNPLMTCIYITKQTKPFSKKEGFTKLGYTPLKITKVCSTFKRNSSYNCCDIFILGHQTDKETNGSLLAIMAENS